jgi:predicted CoA-binding protein
MTIAIIGAGSRREKYANKAVRAWMNQATVVPVHPVETVVEGLPVVRSVENYEGTIDVASFYVPPPAGLFVVEECARKGIATIWLNPGSESVAILERCAELGIAVEGTCTIIRGGFSPLQL